eukprot:scaffold24737_cov101-Isochrysis_galbana.AAC.1
MPKVIKVILSLSRLDKTRRLHNIRWHPHISSQEHSSDKRRHPSESGSTGRQKDSHARQGNTQLSSSQQKNKLRERVEGHDGASPASAGAHQGCHIRTDIRLMH